MYPYIEFIDPAEMGYTEDMRARLLETSEEIADRYRPYVSTEGYVNQLEYCGLIKHEGVSADDFEITKVMRDLIQPQHTIQAAVYVRFQPRACIFPHVDDNSERSTCLTFPLAPSEHFAPTIFFENETDQKPIAVANWDGRPGALNTREFHAVYNNEHTRYTFQLCFDILLDDFMKLHNKGEIFRE
jgi:hypothetical protein